MFGSTFGQTNQPAGGGLFVSSANTGTQQGGGLFGGLGTNNQQSQQQSQQQTGGLFGGLGQNPQNQQQSGGILGLGQSTQQQQPQQSGGMFGLSQNNQQQGGGLFGGSSRPGGLFTNSTQQQPLAQPQQSQLGSSLWQPNSSINPRRSLKSVINYMLTLNR